MGDQQHNSVTRQDLSDALAVGARRRPSTLMNAAPKPSRPAWDWDTELGPGERLELHELRQVVAEQRAELEGLDAARKAADGRAQGLHAALERLAAAGPFRRRAVIAELRDCGLL